MPIPDDESLNDAMSYVFLHFKYGAAWNKTVR